MKIYSLTDIGAAREMNQDYFFTSDEPVGILPNLFIVADGMGGHKAGEFASRFTVEKIVETVTDTEEKTIPAILEQAIKKANKELIAYANSHRDMLGMGTTVVACCLDDNCLCVANVGDSRLYVVGEDSRQITQDHSLVQEMVRMGELDADKAKTHPDKNIITRAIGADDQLKVDFFDVELREGDKVLLCSDGLTNMIEDEEMYAILNDDTKELDDKVETLVRIANNNGGKDNITVVVFEPTNEGVATC